MTFFRRFIRRFFLHVLYDGNPGPFSPGTKPPEVYSVCVFSVLQFLVYLSKQGVENVDSGTGICSLEDWKRQVRSPFTRGVENGV